MATPEDLPEVTEAELRAAEERMIERRRSTPLAISATYDRRIGRVVVRLNTGLELAFPPHLAEGLEHARVSDLGAIEISPTGLGLHFPSLDADLYVPALLEGVFGSEAWAERHVKTRARRETKTAERASHRRGGRRKTAKVG